MRVRREWEGWREEEKGRGLEGVKGEELTSWRGGQDNREIIYIQQDCQYPVILYKHNIGIENQAHANSSSTRCQHIVMRLLSLSKLVITLPWFWLASPGWTGRSAVCGRGQTCDVGGASEVCECVHERMENHTYPCP